MNKEKTKEAIRVMQAFVDGKEIEFQTCYDSYTESDSPHWNWSNGIERYRIKPEPHYRPFGSAEEVTEAIKEHGDWIVGVQGLYRKITGIGRMADDTECKIKVNSTDWMTLTEAIDCYNFLDGTPFGKLVED